MSEFKEIKASYPCCYASKDKIIYKNSGPIVRIYCSDCVLVYNDIDARAKGFNNLIDFWNRVST